MKDKLEDRYQYALLVLNFHPEIQYLELWAVKNGDNERISVVGNTIPLGMVETWLKDGSTCVLLETVRRT